MHQQAVVRLCYALVAPLPSWCAAAAVTEGKVSGVSQSCVNDQTKTMGLTIHSEIIVALAHWVGFLCNLISPSVRLHLGLSLFNGLESNGG